MGLVGFERTSRRPNPPRIPSSPKGPGLDAATMARDFNPGLEIPPRHLRPVSAWSDSDFLAAVGNGTFSAEPWHAADLTPNGLDLRISHVLVPALSPEPITSGVAKVPPMTRFVVGTQAYLKMPREAIGSLWIRSSYSRKGVLAAFGKVDAVS